MTTVSLTSTRRSGLVDQVIDQLRQTIADGDWPVGQRIPPESHLVEVLGVSRNTVREAVRALAHAGLLEVRQGDGTFVRATSELSGVLRRAELREVLQVRRALEVEAARLAASARTDADLHALREALGARDHAAHALDEERERMVDLDTRFHQLVVRCSHNTLLIELYQGVLEAVRASVLTTAHNPALPWVLDHGRLLAAIEDGDAERSAHEAGVIVDELLRSAGE